MSIIGKLLGSTEIIKEGMALIDNMHTSDVEEIEAKSKAKTDLLSAYAPFKVAQRYLALIFAFTFVSCFVLVMGMTLTGQINDLNGVKQVIDDFYIGEIMLLIIGFYFGGGFGEGIITAVKKDKK
jgi:hypothetical protein